MKWNEYGQIVGVNNAIRKYLNKEYFHEIDEDVYAWLCNAKSHRVVVLLIDAMGISVMKKHLSQDGFFLSNTFKSITTVFPPTTSAATTSLRTGLYPNETGWLGWNEYFKEKDDNIILFLNSSQYRDKTYPNFSYETLPVPFLDEEDSSTSIWPVWGKKNASKDYEDLLQNILVQCEKENINYVYAYYDALDTCMHTYGPSSLEAKQMLFDIEKKTSLFAKKLPKDTSLIVVADHSQIDVTFKSLIEQKELVDSFKHLPALEPRTISFYIKENAKESFEKKFNELYENTFKLYSHEEVLKEHIFGPCASHPRFEEFIGDYLAIATSNVSLSFLAKKKNGGDHAGGLKEEAMVPLILYHN